MNYRPVDLNASNYIELLADALGVTINDDGSINEQTETPEEQQTEGMEFEEDALHLRGLNLNASSTTSDNFDFNALNEELNDMLNSFE